MAVAVVALLLAGLLVPAASAGTAPTATPAAALVNPVTGRKAPLDTWVRAGYSVRDALQLVLVNQLVAAGVPLGQVGLRVTAAPAGPCFASSMSMVGGSYGDIEAAGDLNGDRRRDVLEVHGVTLTPKRFAWTGSARDARTGRVLWRRHLVHSEDEGAYLMAAPVGRPARPGAVLVRYSFATSQSGSKQTTQLRLSFEGLDGRGRTVWRRAMSGSYVGDVVEVSGQYHDYPYAVDSGRFRSGTEDLVVTRYSTNAQQVVDARFERIGLASGDLSHPYPPMAGAAPTDVVGQVTDLLLGGSGEPVLWVVPDQSGDRRPDVAVVRRLGGSSLHVFRGDTGAAVWTSLPLPQGVSIAVYDGGVLTQGETRVHDLVVVAQRTGISVAGELTGDSDRTSGLVLLLQGGTGTLAWVLPGAGVFTLHRYRGTPAIGLISTDAGFPPFLTPAGRYLQVDVVGANGLPLASNRYALQQTLLVCDAGWVVVVNEDDLDGDGSPEAKVDFQQYNEVQWADSYLTVDGGTGAVRDRSEAAVIGGSVDGHQPDRGLLTAVDDALRVVVVRGEDVTKQLLSTTLPFTGQLRFGGNVHAVAGTSDRCLDVEAASWTSDATTLRLLASNGHTWWTVRADSGNLTGALVGGSGARPRC